MEFDDDVNWDYVSIPTINADGMLHLEGAMDISKKKINRPDHTYSMLSERAEQTGGLVTRPSEDVIEVRSWGQEEYFKLHYDGSGDLYKVTMHKPSGDQIAEMTYQEIKKTSEAGRKAVEQAEFRGVFDDKWEEGDTKEELFDMLYSNETHGHGAYIEVDYQSKREGTEKTIKGEVLEMERNVQPEGYDIIRVSRKDGGIYYGIEFQDGEAVMMSLKNENLTELGKVKAVFLEPYYHTPSYK